jgi:hypothetical protein
MTSESDAAARGRSRALLERSPALAPRFLALKEGAHGGTTAPVMDEWGYSCRLVDLMDKLL